MTRTLVAVAIALAIAFAVAATVRAPADYPAIAEALEALGSRQHGGKP
jgi:hypothetical protein